MPVSGRKNPPEGGSSQCKGGSVVDMSENRKEVGMAGTGHVFKEVTGAGSHRAF